MNYIQSFLWNTALQLTYELYSMFLWNTALQLTYELYSKFLWNTALQLTYELYPKFFIETGPYSWPMNCILTFMEQLWPL